MDKKRLPHRRYDEKELRALIQRATELSEGASGGSEGSLSLTEIERIAAKLGLPPEHVRTAALESEVRAPSASARSFRLFGAPFVIDHARVVDATMTEEQWSQIVMGLRSFTGKKGQLDEVGSAREWTHAVGEGEGGVNFVRTRVAVRPGDGHTSIEVRKQYGATAIPAYVVTLILTVLALEAVELPNLLNFGILLGAFAAVRGSIATWARRQKERLGRMTDLLQQTLSAPRAEVVAAPEAAEPFAVPELEGGTDAVDDGAAPVNQLPEE